MISRRSALLAWIGALVAPVSAQTISPGNNALLLGTARNLPECDKPTECRFLTGMSMTTLNACLSTFDRQGRAVSPGCSNTTTTEYRCLTCGKSWTEKF